MVQGKQHGGFFQKELPSSLQDAERKKEDKKDQKKKVSTIYLMHDGFNVWCNLWNVTHNKK